MFDRLGELAQEHADLERTLADSAVHADPDRARALSRRYGEISPVVETYHQWQQTAADEATARELATRGRVVRGRGRGPGPPPGQARGASSTSSWCPGTPWTTRTSSSR